VLNVQDTDVARHGKTIPIAYFRYLLSLDEWTKGSEIIGNLPTVSLPLRSGKKDNGVTLQRAEENYNLIQNSNAAYVPIQFS
jgi:hypothetical protein